MPKSVIGVEMYTVREFMKTPADLAKTCKRIREIGYEVVETAALPAIDNHELAKIFQNEGLTVAATHMSVDKMREVNACADFQAALNCKYTAVGYYKFPEPVTGASYRQFAHEFSDLAKQLAAKGVQIGYHNHSHELAHYDGMPGLEILLRHCDKSIWFEIDTYWIAHGGGDPAVWIDRVADSRPGYSPCVHLKDMSVTHARVQKMSEVGAGNLNWPRILDSCKRAGVEWFIVERDDGDLDAFESLKISLENLRAMGVH